MTSFDHIVLGLYLFGVLALGWHFRHAKSHQEHFLASRQMGFLPVGISIMVTSFSAINYIAIPEEIVGHGLYVIVSFPVFFLAAWPIAKIWMPFFNRLQTTTVYAFLEQRYDTSVRQLTSGLFLLWRMGWMAVALYVSGNILAAFSGWHPLIMLAICGLVATVYTSLGGMRAVMWTDVLQFIILFASILFAVFFAIGTSQEGVVSAIWEAGRFKPFTPLDSSFFSFDPTIRMTLWSGLLGVFVAFMARYGSDQVIMQRYFAAKDLKTAQRGIWLNAAASVLSLSLLACLGLAVYAFAINTGQIIPGKPVPRGTALLYFTHMVKSFPAGMTGLAVAGILAATMSSLDSGINACSAAIVTDLVPHRGKGLNSQLLTLSLGIAVTLLALALSPYLNQHRSIFAVINKLVNGLGSPLLAMVALGMFSRFTTARGMFWGGLLGLFASLAISFFLKPLALQYYAVANLIVSLAACYLCSVADRLLTKRS